MDYRPTNGIYIFCCVAEITIGFVPPSVALIVKDANINVPFAPLLTVIVT